ncbi:MAG: hypothetical protein FIA89_13785 [Geobacter sp.]|nr:hypothetical protein [Geobacter sp.]
MKITKENMTRISKPVTGQVDYFDTELYGFVVRASKDTLTFFVRSRQRETNKKPFTAGYTREDARLMPDGCTQKSYLYEKLIVLTARMNPDQKDTPK